MNNAKDRIISFLIVLLGIGVILILAGTCNIGSDGKNGSYEPKIPSSTRTGPATSVRQEYWGVKVFIDGTNEVKINNGVVVEKGMGHNTTVVLRPGESADIEYMGGKLTYRDTESKKFEMKDKDPRYIGFSWGPNDLWREERVRYRNSGIANALLIILRTDSGEEKIYTFENCRKITVINSLEESARIFLFLNTKEYFYDRETGELENGFQYNGWFGSRSVFDIMTTNKAGE